MKTNEEKILNILYRFRNDITFFCNTLNEKIEELEQMESSSENPNKSENPTSWIPVSERLPKIGQRILVTYNQEDEVKIDITNYTKHGFLLSVVTAWMPLPEPYKAESEEV